MEESGVQNPGLNQIGQIAVPVADIERAILFYRDTLGMTFLFQAPRSLAFFDLSGVRLMLDGFFPRSRQKSYCANERSKTVTVSRAAEP